MLTLIIWWSGIILELAIMLRAWQQKTLTKYPFFYLYVASLLLCGCVAICPIAHCAGGISEVELERRVSQHSAELRHSS